MTHPARYAWWRLRARILLLPPLSDVYKAVVIERLLGRSSDRNAWRRPQPACPSPERPLFKVPGHKRKVV